MAINFTWNVSRVETYPTLSGKSDVICKVNWELKGVDDSNNDENGDPINWGDAGTVDLDTSDLSSFTDFSSVNASQVQGWVEAALTADEVTRIKSNIETVINKLATPTTVSKTIGS